MLTPFRPFRLPAPDRTPPGVARAAVLLLAGLSACGAMGRLDQAPVPHAPRAAVAPMRVDEPPPPDTEPPVAVGLGRQETTTTTDSARAPDVGGRGAGHGRRVGRRPRVRLPGIFRPRDRGVRSAEDAIVAGTPYEVGEGADTALLAWRGLHRVVQQQTMPLSFAAVRSALARQHPLEVRPGVWPGAFTRVADADSLVVLEAEWVAFVRFPRDEFRCSFGVAALSPLSADAAAVRFQAAIRPDPRGVRVTVTPETRGLTTCRGSVWARDRARALVWDLYLALNRESALGGLGRLR